ncbi:MAG: endonuclease [Candidatus Diapherotrites archaeon]|nr:endonuclease [Candidatus Diapherotrites archaeon]
MKEQNIFKLYELLSSYYGIQNWWPVSNKSNKIEYKRLKKLTGHQKLEICIGAILAQNTNWKNAELAILRLLENEFIDTKKLSFIDKKDLASLIRSSGYFNQKAERIKNFCNFLMKNYDGDINKFLSLPLQELRDKLLSLKGIGKETADSIILYAANKPIFVVDAYTKRVLERFLRVSFNDYDEYRNYIENHIEKEVFLFKEYHALIVVHCKEFCKKKPLCRDCFLSKSCFYVNSKNNKIIN